MTSSLVHVNSCCQICLTGEDFLHRTQVAGLKTQKKASPTGCVRLRPLEPEGVNVILRHKAVWVLQTPPQQKVILLDVGEGSARQTRILDSGRIPRANQHT